MPESVRITITQITVNPSTRLIGSGRIQFFGTVGAASFGGGGLSTGQPAIVDATAGASSLDAAAAGWQTVVPLAGLNSLDVSVRAVDADNHSTLIGSTTHTFSHMLTVGAGRILFVAQGEHTDVHREFDVTFTVEPEVAGKFAVQPPGAVFATRANNGGVSYTTVSGDVQLSRLELCPVRPVPPDANMPPRPVFVPAAGPPKLNGAGLAAIGLADPINHMPNPSVIPIIAAGSATAQNCAKIEFTYFRPTGLNFTFDDERLEWSASPADKVRFLNDNRRGLRVYVCGIGAAGAADVEVILTVKFRGADFAKYRAIVGHVKNIVCRFTILNGPAGPAADPNQDRPRATAANILAHMHVANIFLRQMGVQLSLDTNVTTNTARPGGGAALTVTASGTTGIFSADVPGPQTRNAPWNSDWLAVNYRQNIVNFIYIKSSTLGALGFAFSYPDNPGRTTAGAVWDKTDTGTPSSSWKVPSGVLPDAAAGTVTQHVLKAYNCVPSAPANLYGMVVTDLVDPATAAGALSTGNTIAHEVGHMLSLGHRVENPADLRYDDGVNHPPRQNAMHWNAPGTVAQDFDIIQSKIARASSLCT